MKDTTANFIFSGKRTVNYSSLSKWKNWKKPYDNPNIDSIVTGLQGKFAYSPKFRKPIAETSIVLTGYRRKDYCEAEQVTNEIHQPKKTVWHHVWEEKNGEYTTHRIYYRGKNKSGKKNDSLFRDKLSGNRVSSGFFLAEPFLQGFQAKDRRYTT